MPVILDLPSFAPSLGVEEEDFARSSITVRCDDDIDVTGQLIELNGPLASVTILESMSNLVVKKTFDDIYLLRFTLPAHLSHEASHKLEDSLSTKSEFVFNDGHKWSCYVFAHIVDQFGIHLLVTEKERVFRYFVPSNHIQQYRIGAFLGEQLVLDGKISEQSVADCLEQQKQGPNKRRMRLGEMLVQTNQISEAQLTETMAKKFGLGFLDLHDHTPDESALDMVPERVARDYKVVPLKLTGTHLQVAVNDPANSDAQNMISFLTGLTLDVSLASKDDIDWALDKYYTLDKNLAVIESQEQQDALKTDESLAAEARRLGTDRPIVRLVNLILAQAIHRGASDIHIRPNENEIELLFRIDGTMVKIKELSKSFLKGLVARIKIIGRMDVSKHNIPQDGQTRVREENAIVDMRISMLPTVDGESVVIRLMNTKYGPLRIEQLGFSEQEEIELNEQLEKKHGLILVTGPTGSGKSTTLYAALDKLRVRNQSIITIEEPVEFHIPGVDQVQVDEKTGLTFARVLRNILRHDPDVIMIGEIRDKETARIAVQSSLTGHLVLSTLHTNSAIGAVSRLFDMGIEPYLLAPTLLSVLAQRLLKKNCQNCLKEDEIKPLHRIQLDLNDDCTVYVGAGCDKCDSLGTKGRVGVYELLPLSGEVRDLIYENGDESKILEAALTAGMTTLAENAKQKLLAGTIPITEAYSVSIDL